MMTRTLLLLGYCLFSWAANAYRRSRMSWNYYSP